MPRFKATIDLYIDMGERWLGDAEGSLADGISGIMELTMQQTHEAGDEFVLADWSYHPDGSDYSAGYAKPFDGPTPAEALHAVLS